MKIGKKDIFYRHMSPTPGKLNITTSKNFDSVDDLKLLYTPGVAAVCQEIQKNPQAVALYTTRNNTVAVISNGTAVLGLGNIGPLAAKPVTESKAALLCEFGKTNSFDLVVKTQDVDKLIMFCKLMSHSCLGIMLEDIAAPSCFEIEQKLVESLSDNNIIYHDDQHGTAIVILAGLINACKLQKKEKSNCKTVINGAGAAAIATARLLHNWGLNNITMFDSKGVIHKKRTDLNKFKRQFCITEDLSLTRALENADIFIGLSVGNVLTAHMISKMSSNPIIFCLANPIPEISPEIAANTKPNAIIATGRSGDPNQVNNLLAFPYIFRGTLDGNINVLTPDIKIAAAQAIAKIARCNENGNCRKILPSPFNPLLLREVPYSIIQAAYNTKVITHLPTKEEYLKHLDNLCAAKNRKN